VDLEDLGAMLKNKPKKEAKTSSEDEEIEEKKEAPRAMLTDQLRAVCLFFIILKSPPRCCTHNQWSG
jgi:hypothetical protein